MRLINTRHKHKNINLIYSIRSPDIFLGGSQEMRQWADKVNFSKERIVFVHIPKTAGSALSASISEKLDNFYVYRTRMQKVDNIRSSIYSEVANDLYQHFLSYIGRINNKHYLIPRKVSPLEASKARFIWGHFRLGSEPATELSSRYITLIRDPVDRFIGNYIRP